MVLNGMANCHRTDVLAMMGGFPDDSVTEDFNLTWALHRQGYPVAFTPEAVVYPQEPGGRLGLPSAWPPTRPRSWMSPRFWWWFLWRGMPWWGDWPRSRFFPLLPLRDKCVLAVVGLVVDPDLGGEYRGGHQPTRGVDHPAVSSVLVSPPDPHRSGHDVVAGSGMGARPSPDSLDRSAWTSAHPDPHDTPPQGGTGRHDARGCDGPGVAPRHSAQSRRAEPAGGPVSLTRGRAP